MHRLAAVCAASLVIAGLGGGADAAPSPAPARAQRLGCSYVAPMRDGSAQLTRGAMWRLVNGGKTPVPAGTLVAVTATYADGTQKIDNYVVGPLRPGASVERATKNGAPKNCAAHAATGEPSG